MTTTTDTFSFMQDSTLQTRIATFARGNQDRAQAVRLKLLEQAQADSSFARQQVGYQIKAAMWEARHDLTKSVIYDRYVSDETFVVGDEGEVVSIFDTLASSDESPETICERNETAAQLAAAIATLPANRRQIAELMLQGYEANEIAAMMSTSTSSINHIQRKMFEALRQAL